MTTAENPADVIAQRDRLIGWLQEAAQTIEQLTTDRDTYRDAWDQTESANADLTQELANVRDTLMRRTESHGRLVADRLACPTCSTKEPL